MDQIKRKSKTVTIDARTFGGKSASFFDLNDHEVITNGYNTNPYVYSVVNRLANLSASIPLKVVKIKDKKRSKQYQAKGWKQRVLIKLDKSDAFEDATESDLAGLLQRPNPQDGFIEFSRSFYINKLTTGNGYIDALRHNDVRPPTELWVLPPLSVTLNESSDFYNKIKEIYFNWGATSKTIQPENFMHSYYYNPTGSVYGLSPLSAARQAVTGINDGSAHNVAVLQNGAKQEFVILVADGTPEEDKEKIRKDWTERYTGPYNANKVIVTDEGFMKFEKLGYTMKDMDFANLQLSDMRKVYDVYGVNSESFNDPANKTMSNKRDAARSMYVDRVIPETDVFVDELNRWLTPMFGDKNLMIIADLSEVDALNDEEDKVYERLNNTHFLTPNQKLAIAGQEQSKDPAMDLVYLPANLIPIGGSSDDLNRELMETYGLRNGVEKG